MRFPIRLLLRYLFKHPVRTSLTLGSLIVALFLVCTLFSLLTTIEAGVKNARPDRLITQSAMSLFVDMPRAYLGQIKEIEGIREVVSWNWFGGIYKDDPKSFFAQFGVSSESLFATYPEIELVEGTKEDFMGDRKSCIVGKTLAEQWDVDWKVGDTIPLRGTIYPRADDSMWEFRIAAIYKSNAPNVDQQTMFFHEDYLREAQDSKAALGPEGVGVIVALIEKSADPVAIGREIDRKYENGPQRTQTGPESEFQAQFVSMLGNVPLFLRSIGGAVTFAILLAVVNTMLLAAREQTRDVGILKALGFSSTVVFLLFFGQSIVLAALGGGAGIALAKSMEAPIRIGLSTMFPGYTVLDETVRNAILLALFIGIAAGVTPAFLVVRRKVVDALRTEA